MKEEDNFDFKQLKDFWSVYTITTAVGLGVSMFGMGSMFVAYAKGIFIYGFSILLTLKLIVLLGLYSKHKEVFRKIAFATLLLILSALIYASFFSIAMLFSFFGVLVIIPLAIILAYLGFTIYGLKMVKAGSLFIRNENIEQSLHLNPRIRTFWIIMGCVLVLPALTSIISAHLRLMQLWQLLGIFFIYSIWLKREHKYLKWALIYILAQTAISLFYFVRGLIPLFIEGPKFLSESPFVIIGVTIQTGIIALLFWGITIHYRDYKKLNEEY